MRKSKEPNALEGGVRQRRQPDDRLAQDTCPEVRGSATTIGADTAHDVDGFVGPVSRDHRDEDRRLVEAVAEIWKEHGALDDRECVGDDLHLEGTRSFSDVLAAREGEAVVFGWVVFESREV